MISKVKENIIKIKLLLDKQKIWNKYFLYFFLLVYAD